MPELSVSSSPKLQWDFGVVRGTRAEKSSPRESIIHPGAPWLWGKWTFNEGVWFFLIRLKQFILLWRAIPLDLGMVGRWVSLVSLSAELGGGDEEALSCQFCASRYWSDKSHKFYMFPHNFSLSWFCDILKPLYVKEKVWKRGLWCWQTIHRSSFSLLINIKVLLLFFVFSP